jgi:alanine racemase
MAGAIRSAEGLRLAGIYTHFATADDADPNYMREQLRQFRSAAEAVPGRDELVLHAANSAATIGAAGSHLDMVRCGLAVYGYQPAEPWHGHPAHESQGHLAPAGSSFLSVAASDEAEVEVAAEQESEEEAHGQDARGTHGRDGHATKNRDKAVPESS